MVRSKQMDDISFDSLYEDVKGYSWNTFKNDLLAGVSVTLVSLPQAMAFALVAGLPLSCGILASIFGTCIAALFGSSRHLVVGPTNAGAILVQYATSEIMYTFYRDVVGAEREMIAIQILTQLVLLVALFQMAAATMRLGRLVQFVSHSVVVGYLVGTASAVVITQLYVFLGLPAYSGFHSLFDRFIHIFTSIGEIHWATAFVGLGSLMIYFVVTKVNKQIPAAVFVLVLASIAVHFLGLSNSSDFSLLAWVKEASGHVHLVGDEGEIQDVIMNFTLPAFNSQITSYMIPVAFAIALIGIIETSLIAKNMATSSGQRFSVNQEILGLGLGNLFSSFIGALPSSGSPTRSALIYHNGGQTRFAGIISGLGVGIAVLMFGSIISLTPMAALSALLLITAFRIVNSSQFLLCLKATYSDAFVLVATFLSCMFFTLDVAFYVGIGLSITFYLNKAAEPNFFECTYDESGRLGSVNSAWKRERKEIRVINVQGELFFGAADIFQLTLKSIAQDDDSTHVIILRLKNARDIDATACLALQQLFEYLRSSGRHLIACGLSHASWQVLCDSGVVEKIGKENLFILDEAHPRLTLQKALARASELIQEDREEQQALENEQMEATMVGAFQN